VSVIILILVHCDVLKLGSCWCTCVCVRVCVCVCLCWYLVELTLYEVVFIISRFFPFEVMSFFGYTSFF